MNLRMIIRLPTLKIIEVNEEEEETNQTKNPECQAYVCNR